MSLVVISKHITSVSSNLNLCTTRGRNRRKNRYSHPESVIENNQNMDTGDDEVLIDDRPPPASPQRPHVVITEQPHPKLNRFRYECEGRLAGSIVGVHTTREQKTHPSIEVRGFKGRAVVVVSCVTKDRPYRPHPHGLVGKERCNQGICTIEINSNTMSHTFHLGVQCVRKKDIAEALRIRAEKRIDPFRTGFNHATQPASLDLSAVRLCFQVFLEGPRSGRFTVPLAPVVSEIFNDKKSSTMSELVICRLSDCTAPVTGGKKIILLCEKVVKEDITVRFYEEQNGAVLWEGTGEFQQTSVHKQYAICFLTPRYRSVDVEHSVMVNIQLLRPSDGATSEPRQFEFVPADLGNWKHKRKRTMFNSWNVLGPTPDVAQDTYCNLTQNTPLETIKMEPAGSPSNPFFGFTLSTPSPTSLGGMNPAESVSPYLREAAAISTAPTDYFHQETQPYQLHFDAASLGNDILQESQLLDFMIPNHHQQHLTIQPGPSGSAVAMDNSRQKCTTPPEYNLSSLLDMNHQQLLSIQPGPSGSVVDMDNTPQEAMVGTDYNLNNFLDVNIDSSEIRSIINNFTENTPD
ncbi:embryonic polarity protein dorsal-like isoform X2 [Toxorhynchites rutilus septentrionalis]|uniref:embryonic polarity protein dorsal-like isoform X2 n=1 Tax=Toxorhynchites rutilus septentrionalis TaxID=329112 RepID=UPI0024792F8A|nr:embryonic polarity protein dorsal-like isoform X2 [Toxorhynchites rutilus septentrionalis]